VRGENKKEFGLRTGRMPTLLTDRQDAYPTYGQAGCLPY